VPAANSEGKGKENFYGRRKGRPLRAGRKQLMKNLLPALSVPMEAPDINPQSLFDSGTREIWVEIGFGNGEHLAWQAAHNPDVGLIGCEPFINGVSVLLSHVEEQALKNVRIHADDARPLLDRLPDASLTRAFVLFPDPWPKKRHAYRRFVGPENLDRLARVLAPGAILRVASDHPGYVVWALRHLQAHPSFDWLAERADDWRIRPDDWPPTRYEEKALAGVPVYLTYQRV